MANQKTQSDASNHTLHLHVTVRGRWQVNRNKFLAHYRDHAFDRSLSDTDGVLGTPHSCEVGDLKGLGYSMGPPH